MRGNILVIGNRLLGDSIDSLPAILILQKKFPHAEFHLLSFFYTQKIYQIFPFSKNYLIDDKADYVNDKLSVLSKFWQWLTLYKKLKHLRKKYTGIFILTGGIGFSFLAKWLSPQWSIGHGNGGRFFFLTYSTPSSKLVANYENFNQIANLSPSSIPSLQLKKLNQQYLVEMAERFGKITKKIDLKDFLLNNKSYIVISPMASEKSKTWPGEYFYRLANKLVSEYNILWVGLEKEKSVIDSIRQGVGINLAGIFSLPEVFYLIKKTKVFISNNSGLAHAAGMLGVRTFILIGEGNPTLDKPYDASPQKDQVHCIFNDFDNISHDQRKKAKYREQFSMKNLSFNKVYSFIKENI